MGLVHVKVKMAGASTGTIPAFTKENFTSYLKLLRAACAKGDGVFVMSGKDPITAHVNDDFVKAIVDKYERRAKAKFLKELPTEKQIGADPKLVRKGLSVLYSYKTFIGADEADFKIADVRAEYSQLSQDCERWIRGESMIHAVCCTSLEAGNMLQLDDTDISKN